MKHTLRLSRLLAAVVASTSCSSPPPYVAPEHHPANARARAASMPRFDDLAAPLAAPEAREAIEPSATEAWRCPMHPHVAQDVPGTCSICGMALESVSAGSKHEDHRR